MADSGEHGSCPQCGAPYQYRAIKRPDGTEVERLYCTHIEEKHRPVPARAVQHVSTIDAASPHRKPFGERDD